MSHQLEVVEQDEFIRLWRIGLDDVKGQVRQEFREVLMDDIKETFNLCDVRYCGLIADDFLGGVAAVACRCVFKNHDYSHLNNVADNYLRIVDNLRFVFRPGPVGSATPSPCEKLLPEVERRRKDFDLTDKSVESVLQDHKDFIQGHKLFSLIIECAKITDLKAFDDECIERLDDFFTDLRQWSLEHLDKTSCKRVEVYIFQDCKAGGILFASFPTCQASRAVTQYWIPLTT